MKELNHEYVKQILNNRIEKAVMDAIKITQRYVRDHGQAKDEDFLSELFDLQDEIAHALEDY